VIALGVGEHHSRQRSHAEAPQLAVDACLGWALVYQDRPARDFQESGVTLTHVEERHA
jgi:hypothetical protein